MNTLSIRLALCMTRHDIAGVIHRHIYRNGLVSKSEPQQTQNQNSSPQLISPPSLKPRNKSHVLQTSTTTLESHCQVKTTIILFSEMTR